MLLVLTVLATLATPAITDSSHVATLTREAISLRPLFHSHAVRGFLDAVPSLPHVETRTIYCDSARTYCLTGAQAAAVPDSQRAHLVKRDLDESFYYETRYGSPLAYARPLEILSNAGFGDLHGKRIADFGYGTIGHLRLLASNGAYVHGIDVDPLLQALYAPDVGAIGRGTLALHHGQWPAESPLVVEVGSGYDLFLSKNTLKHGYIHPAEQVNPRMLVHLGVDDSAYVAALARTVKPRGLVMIYNLCPAPAAAGKPYIPWADGRCPFERSLLERSGFEVIAFDRDDSPAARQMAHALGWDAGDHPMDLEHDLFATYTLLRRRSN